MARARVFSFEVPTDSHPGDVCSVHLPDGSCVEVTLPESAVPGTTIELEVPDDGGTDTFASGENVPDAVPCRLYWEGEPQSSARSPSGSHRSSGLSKGLSNSRLERIYAARLPPGHPPHEPLHVELAPGGSRACLLYTSPSPRD